MTDEPLTFRITKDEAGYTVTCTGVRVTGFPSHSDAAFWVMEYVMRMIGAAQRQAMTAKWLGGQQGVTE